MDSGDSILKAKKFTEIQAILSKVYRTGFCRQHQLLADAFAAHLAASSMAVCARQDNDRNEGHMSQIANCSFRAHVQDQRY